MAIVNRDLDGSQQKDVYAVRIGGGFGASAGLVTGLTLAVLPVPYACELESVRTYAQGVSGSPIISFFKNVYVSGSGQTVYAMGLSGIVLVNFASIGLQGASILSGGATTLQLSAGDEIIITTTGANSACTELSINLVLQKLQDIVSTNGQQ